MSNVEYSDYELCVLEHIIYMRGDEDIKSMKIKEGKSYKPLEDCKNVGEYVDQFDISDFRGANASEHTAGGEQISRNEYAAVIEYMQDETKSSKIRALTLNKAMNMEGEAVSVESMHSLPDNEKNYKVLAYDLTDPNSDEHIVVFKGTEGGNEWKDNVEGLGKIDTKAQLDAYNFIESIEGKDNITVVGHSKGGNKAMYCTVRSDKIKKCVSMDGQGFSDEFIQKYGVQISGRASKIKNISYCSDFVHPLMRAIPGSTQLYTGSGYGSNGVRSFAECHSPNSILTYTTDADGKLVLTGEFNYTSETDSIKLIRGLVDYIMYSDCEDKKGLIEYLAYIVGEVGEDKDKFLQAVINGDEKIDDDKLTTIIAYLIKYCNENNISADEVYVLLLDLHVIDGTNTEILTVLRLLFDYLSSNKDDQNYVIPKVALFVFDRYNKNDSYDKWVDMAWNVLHNIKSKYKNIRYDNTNKSMVFADRLKKITVLSDFREATSPMMYYNLQGIQKSLSMMEKAISTDSVNLNSDSGLSGKAYDSFSNVSKFYDKLYSNVYKLIQNTKQRTESVYNAVIELENK